MSTCTCSSEKAEEVEEIKEAPEAAEALEEPVREEDLDKSDDPKEKDSLEKSLATLKKYGFNVYAGKKATPAPKIDTPKAETIDWMNVEKSWDELDEIVGEN